MVWAIALWGVQTLICNSQWLDGGSCPTAPWFSHSGCERKSRVVATASAKPTRCISPHREMPPQGGTASWIQHYENAAIGHSANQPAIGCFSRNRVIRSSYLEQVNALRRVRCRWMASAAPGRTRSGAGCAPARRRRRERHLFLAARPFLGAENFDKAASIHAVDMLGQQRIARVFH